MPKPYQRSTSYRRRKKKVNQKPISRPFVNILSPKELDRVIRYAARIKKKLMSIEEVELPLRPYVEKMVGKL